MQQNRIEGEQALLASILAKNPQFGSAGYLARNPRGLTAAELLTKLHSPTHPGPGPAQRPMGVHDVDREDSEGGRPIAGYRASVHLPLMQDHNVYAGQVDGVPDLRDARCLGSRGTSGRG